MKIEIEKIDNGYIVDLPGCMPSSSDPLAQRGRQPKRLLAHTPEDVLAHIADAILDIFGRTK
jgi:hypothetical protein